jgi:hypothetical protein
MRRFLLLLTIGLLVPAGRNLASGQDRPGLPQAQPIYVEAPGRRVPVAPPPVVRGIFLNSWGFGSIRFDNLLRLADTTEINAFVIDVKDDTGYLTYRSSVPTAVAIGANGQLRAPDARIRLARMRERGVHAIARIVVAKDPLLAQRKPEWAVQHREGGLWRDRLQFAWVDAFQDSVWIYAAQLAEEAVQLGFNEIQYDYVRFPDEPRSRLATAVFPGRRAEESSREGVRRNLALLSQRTRALGVPVTVDVFGLTTTVVGDMGIGQVWEDLVTLVDVVLPMVYPSHYQSGVYGVSHPNAEPYRMVRRALEEAMRRSALVEGPTAEIRPFLQAFTLGSPRYTPWHVQEQIRATEDVGLKSWILWNPRSAYDPGIFRRPNGLPHPTPSRTDSIPPSLTR